MSACVNKTIGIITYHRVINYGAILQVYALQKKIKEIGANCIVLDYRNERLENRHKKMKLSECKSIKEFVRDCLLFKNHNIKYDKFRGFAKDHFDFSPPLYRLSDLKEEEKGFDKIITGSDQVWNYRINDMDATYFLEFIEDNSKKATYAASFGLSTIPKKYRQKYYDLLKDFRSILIREKQGAVLIKELLGKEAQVVLDPTLLISKEEWGSLIKDKSLINMKYILVYAFGRSTNIMNLAKKISKETGYKIIWISNTYRMSISIKYIKAAGPEEFLALFKNAEYIVTNSFHGTAFAINFNKQFFTELLPESLGVNSRLEDILDLFEIESRIIKSCDPSVINAPIDYKKINKILAKEREKSTFLLKKIILNL